MAKTQVDKIMKLKKFFVFCLALVFPLTIAGREKMVSSQIDGIKDKTAKVIRRAVNQSAGDTEDPDEVFSRAIDAYKDEFKEYLDVTALNVQDKEAINLPDFDVNYVASEFYDVMYDYQTKLEASLTPLQLERYELLRKQDYNFDRYVTLNSIKFSNLNPSLKYIHDVKPVNPTLPITPVNPTLPGGGSSTTRVAVAATAEIIGILEGAGLAQKIINAFTACISTMTTGLSTSWIPFVGWALAVALITGALIALVVIIVKNWDKIKAAINDIKAWFLEQFSRFASLLESFFADAIAQGNESVVAYRKEIDGRTREFVDTEITTAVLSKIVDKCLKNDTVYLLGHIGDPEKGEHWWICYDTTKPQVVIDEKLYNFGICTYTWYNNTAKRMMAYGSLLNGDYSSLIYERPDKGTALVHGEENLIGWNHYHLGHKVTNNGASEVIKYETRPLKWAHSMFGKLSYRSVGGSDYTYYPSGNLG